MAMLSLPSSVSSISKEPSTSQELFLQAERLMGTIKYYRFQLEESIKEPELHLRLKEMMKYQFNALIDPVTFLCARAPVLEHDSSFFSACPLTKRARDVQRELICLENQLKSEAATQTVIQYSATLLWDSFGLPIVPTPFILTPKEFPSPEICWGKGLSCHVETIKSEKKASTDLDIDPELLEHVVRIQDLAFQIQTYVDSILTIISEIMHRRSISSEKNTKIIEDITDSMLTPLGEKSGTIMPQITAYKTELEGYLRSSTRIKTNSLIAISVLTKITALLRLIANRQQKLQGIIELQ